MMPRLRALLLLGFWFTAVALVAPFMIALCLVTKNENYIYGPLRWFVRRGLVLVGVRVVVSGLDRLEPNRTYVFTPNHQSLIEVPLLATFLNRNVGYLAKKELFKYPIFGSGIRLMKIVPIDRSNNQAAIESARRATENLRSGKSYVVYPEGTRSPDGRLLQFKKGAFVMALDAGVPIVPVTVSGSASIMPKGQIKICPATVFITVHEPIKTEEYTKESVPDLMALTRGKILSALNEAREYLA